MADALSPGQRSRLMARIKCKDTKPEMLVRKLVYSLGYRYRLHTKDLPGKPDLAFHKKKKAIFVHGCFWHQHEDCKQGHIPKSNQAYWIPKLERTKKRDASNLENFRGMGWEVLVVWECELKDLDSLSERINKFLSK